MQLILFSEMLNQLQNWIMREPVLLWVVVPALSSYIMMVWFMMVELAFGSLLCIRAFW